MRAFIRESQNSGNMGSLMESVYYEIIAIRKECSDIIKQFTVIILRHTP